jgi:hypothetical protein
MISKGISKRAKSPTSPKRGSLTGFKEGKPKEKLEPNQHLSNLRAKLGSLIG